MEEFRKKLSGIWQRAIAVQLVGLLMALILLLAGWYTALYMTRIDPTYAQPYAILSTLFLCLADLLLRSPIRAGQFAFYRDVVCGISVPAFTVLRGFSAPFYRKAVYLRIQLWKKRLLYTALLLLVPSGLLVYASYLQDRMPQTASLQTIYLLCCITAAVFLVAGLFFIELLLLRYMPAWQLLPVCKTVKEALREAKSITKKQLGSWTGLYLWCWAWKCCLFPYFYVAPMFAVVRSEKIEKTSQQVYNPQANVQTDKGAVKAP
ncbi:MAG: hypothetical protein J6R77_03695 [Clostridia bacterium]|nr:hypothetical protein [Clostridia bacterium]